MIKNLAEYFLPEQEFYLDSVLYRRLEKTSNQKEYSLNCIDNLEVLLNENTVKITIKRSLNFDPHEVYDLEVAFGAVLKFNEAKKHEHDWHNINLADEFRKHGEFVLANLMSRTSLLIAEITSSYGQPPLVLPSGIVQK